MTVASVQCFSQAAARLPSLVREQLRSRCGRLDPRRIVIKPNWVLHETDPAFPIRALVTDARLVEAVVESCLELFPGAESLVVGDCPLQWADWPRLCQQSGLTDKRQRLTEISGGRVQFQDWRREVFAMNSGGFLVPAAGEHGDPAGYREVSLGPRSHLEPIAAQSHRFAVNDYRSSITSRHHSPGRHSYLVSQSVLDADLFINLPKWKTHQKSALTAALKNLVGINGDKAYLPHFRRGAPRWGGDEYADDHRWLYWLQTTLREQTQKRSPLLFKLLKPGWELVKRLRGLKTKLTDASQTPRNFYTAGGAWHGNDTVWRMIYDLNLIIQCADRTGQLHDQPQRHYVCMVDALVSGEGNGPLQPLPRETDWLVFGEDPLAIDIALAHFMGYAPLKVPLVARHLDYLGPNWGRFDWNTLEAELDGKPLRLAQSELNFRFAPPPGWRCHVER